MTQKQRSRQCCAIYAQTARILARTGPIGIFLGLGDEIPLQRANRCWPAIYDARRLLRDDFDMESPITRYRGKCDGARNSGSRCWNWNDWSVVAANVFLNS